MENLTILGEEIRNVFKINDNYLLKYSSLTIKAWEALINKKIRYVNTPIIYTNITEEEKFSHPHAESVVFLPFIRKANNLLEISKIKNYTTKETLKLLKLNISLLKQLHQKNVYHGDINEKNIMLSDNRIPIFIDLDAALIDEHISNENIYTNSQNNIEELRKLYLFDDKIDLLMIYFAYLAYGKFIIRPNYYFPINKLGLPQNIEREFKAYINKKANLSAEYYFEDMLDYLLACDYEAKIFKKTN